jgi:glycosyltransferase involved in cell wall biosynthesis
METPFFSIIIPTRNRYSTLHYTLRTVLNQEFSSFEIILADNSDPANLGDVKLIGDLLADDRIKYHRPPSVLSMTDNWEFGVSKASGKFLIIFGDDDGLIEGALQQLCDIILQARTQLVSWARVEYSWPGRLPLQYENLMTIPYMAKTGIVQSKSYIQQVIRYKADYRYLPMFYNSAVSRETVDLMRTKAGRVFNATSPDLYTGYAFAHLLGEYLTVGYPLTINGVSATSNGAAHLNDDQAVMADYWRLIKGSQLKWPRVLPEVNTPYIAIVEPFLQLTSVFPQLGRYISRKEIYKVIIDTMESRTGSEWETKLKRIEDAADDDPSLRKWFEGYARKLSPKIRQGEAEGAAIGFDGSHLVLDGSKFGVANVYDASIFIRNVLGEIKDKDFCKPAIPGMLKRVRKAAAIVLRGI